MLNNETKERVNVRLLKVLASETRLTILEWLKDPVAHFPPQIDGDLIREKLGITAATASRHLTRLTEAGLLNATRKRG